MFLKKFFVFWNIDFLLSFNFRSCRVKYNDSNISERSKEKNSTLFFQSIEFQSAATYFLKSHQVDIENFEEKNNENKIVI